MIGVWATPNMTVTHALFSAGFTAYILIGLWYEERDLIKAHGEEYTTYKTEAGKLFPKFGK